MVKDMLDWLIEIPDKFSRYGFISFVFGWIIIMVIGVFVVPLSLIVAICVDIYNGYLESRNREMGNKKNEN